MCRRIYYFFSKENLYTLFGSGCTQGSGKVQKERTPSTLRAFFEVTTRKQIYTVMDSWRATGSEPGQAYINASIDKRGNRIRTKVKFYGNSASRPSNLYPFICMNYQFNEKNLDTVVQKEEPKAGAVRNWQFVQYSPLDKYS